MRRIVLGLVILLLFTNFSSASLVAQQRLVRIPSFFSQSFLFQLHNCRKSHSASQCVLMEGEGIDASIERIIVTRYYQGLPLFSSKHLNRPAGSRNVGQDTNNLGNLMDGRGEDVIGVYRSPNGRYYSVFATVDDGYNALIKEIERRKQTTKSSRSLLSDFLGGWVLGRDGQLDTKSYYYRYAMRRVGEDKPIKEIPTEVIAEIIMVGESTWDAYKQGGVDLTHLLAYTDYTH